MQYRPPQRRRGLISPWIMSAAIVVVTLFAAWLAGPRNQTGVIVTGAIVLWAISASCTGSDDGAATMSINDAVDCGGRPRRRYARRRPER